MNVAEAKNLLHGNASRNEFLLAAAHAFAQVLHRATEGAAELRKVLGAEDEEW